MCVPGIILLALFAYLPMFGLVLAFKNYKFNLGIFGSEWVGFKNFEFFFTSGTFGRLIRNTLGLNLLFLLCNTVITVLLALLLYEINSRHAIKAFQTVIFLPFIVSWVAASYALYANLADVNGIVNGILTFFGKETVPEGDKDDSAPRCHRIPTAAGLVTHRSAAPSASSFPANRSRKGNRNAPTAATVRSGSGHTRRYGPIQ